MRDKNMLTLQCQTSSYFVMQLKVHLYKIFIKEQYFIKINYLTKIF